MSKIYKPEADTTEIWELYQRGIAYKNKIGYYDEVDENYNYFQGEQWGNTDSKGIPTPVFNVIKPVIRYKVSAILENDTKVIISSGANSDPDFEILSDVSGKLTKYTDRLWEKLKIDYKNETLLYDAAITGTAFSYFVFDEDTQEVEIELIDSVNVYPANPNNADIQSQEYIIIAFRRPVEQVRKEAYEVYGYKDTDAITADNDNIYTAGDDGKIEIDNSDLCVVLLKMWKDYKTGTVHFSKSTRNCEYATDKETGLKLYPVAMMTWENRKNCFFGISDVTGLIPNQDYINTSAAMIMASTTFSSFPKMVYDSTIIENPSNEVGVAIGINGLSIDKNYHDVIGYISPPNISGDIFNMFNQTISLTKELMGASDSALGNIDPENASGRSILAVIQQNATPLESIKRRFYNYIEDCAEIMCDMWRKNSADGKDIIFTDENGNTEMGTVAPETFDRLMLNARIDVGPSTKWSELTTAKTLENLLAANYIPFELYVDLMPDNSGLPKKKIQDWIERQKQQAEEQKRAEAMAQQQQALQARQQAELEQADTEGASMANEDINNFDIDAMLDNLTDEQTAEAMKNPNALMQIIADNIGQQE